MVGNGDPKIFTDISPQNWEIMVKIMVNYGLIMVKIW